MAFNPKKFEQAVASQINKKLRVAEKEVLQYLKEYFIKRLQEQPGFPKKKHPERSGSPLFLVDTGESTRLTIKGKVLSARRPEVLNYPGPKKGLPIWWKLPDDLEQTLNEIIMRNLKK